MVLRGEVQLRVREIVRQVCAENSVEILKGVVSSDHDQTFVSIPPKLAVSDLMRRIKGRSAFKLFREFPKVEKRYWGCHFWGNAAHRARVPYPCHRDSRPDRLQHRKSRYH